MFLVLSKFHFFLEKFVISVRFVMQLVCSARLSLYWNVVVARGLLM